MIERMLAKTAAGFRRSVAPLWLGRVACLGQSVLNLRPSRFLRPVLINQQKVRCDLFLDRLKGAPKPIAEEVRPHLARPYVYGTIVEQELLPWMKVGRKFRRIFMDSFAELTDQKFSHKRDGWSFASHYNDVSHTPQFGEAFECQGLLPIEEMEQKYHDFFTWCFKNGSVRDVVFLHFPTALDARVHFKGRAVAIERIIEKLCLKFPSLLSIVVPENQVESAVQDAYPYHFAEKTNRAFVLALERKERPATFLGKGDSRTGCGDKIKEIL